MRTEGNEATQERIQFKSPYAPRQYTVRDILRARVRLGDIRAMIVLGIYYCYGIGGRFMERLAARLFAKAYSCTNDSAPAYCSRADICAIAGRLIYDRAALRAADRGFANEIRAMQKKEKEARQARTRKIKNKKSAREVSAKSSRSQTRQCPSLSEMVNFRDPSHSNLAGDELLAGALNL